jgi:ectoine hydroxylase-related dioxygenase (phytanoyl-CoA dioxygenase family)
MLTPAQIEEFFEVGFVLRPDVFDADEVAVMRAAFERLERAAYRLGESGTAGGSQFVVHAVKTGDQAPRLSIDRIVWCGACEPVLSDFGRDARLLRMAGQLLGSDDMSQLINQAHFKLPHDGVEFPWHQDSTHRRYGGDDWTDVNGRGSFVQTLTAIDEVTEENGPLEFIPGSCRLGHVPPREDGGLPTDHVDPGHAVSVTMAPGAVVLFGPYVFHRSLPNRSERPRRVFINGFACPGANSRIYPGEGAGRLVSARRPGCGA